MKKKLLMFILVLWLLLYSYGYPQDMTGQIRQKDIRQFPEVSLYILLKGKNGEPIKKLNIKDITIKENGLPVSLKSLRSMKDESLSVVMVVDISGSMKKKKMNIFKRASASFLKGLKSKDRCALILFDHQVEAVYTFTGNFTGLRKRINDIDTENLNGATAMYDALDRAIDMIAQRKGRKAIIVLTDGVTNSGSIRDPLVNIKKAKKSDISIFTIGYGNKSTDDIRDQLDEEVLKTVAEETLGVYYFAGDDTLKDIYEELGRQLQFEFNIIYETANINMDGTQRKIEIEIHKDNSKGLIIDKFNTGGLIPVVNKKTRSRSTFLFFFITILFFLLIPSILKQIYKKICRSLYIKTVGKSSPYKGRLCGIDPLPEYAFKLNDKIIICPKCNTAHHLNCFLELSGGKCSHFSCGWELTV